MSALSSCFLLLISVAAMCQARSVYRHDARETRLRDTTGHLNDLLFISKLAFNFLDANVDHGLSLSEMKFLVGHSLNGMLFRTEKDVEKLFNAMDRNDDSVVSENEFLMFDKWLHAVVHKNGMENGGKVSIARLKEFSTKRHIPFYALLDADNDGFLTTNVERLHVDSAQARSSLRLENMWRIPSYM
uniref:EF-hand domain-containing protein n=1 Tax=Steinernema glaseri TaxID=37863 RepID=A0A1I8AE23_9BILA